MKRRWPLALLALPLSMGLAMAQVTGSQRPEPRPQPTVTEPHPMARPPVTAPLATAPVPDQPVIAPGPHPLPRPLSLGAVPVVPAKPALKTNASLKGAVCQNPAVLGKPLKPIVSRVKGCSVAAPVLVTSVSGVTLNPAATIDCNEANALATWVTQGLQPAFGGTVRQLDVVDSYACRPRNNVRGGKISEHGSGNAIDISGFVTTAGRLYTVAANYNAQIRKAQKAGCGIFHTILGPGSDGYHENHIHFDVAPYRGRPYCH